MLWRMRQQTPASEQRSVPLAAAASAVANSIKGVSLLFTWPLKCIISKLKCSRTYLIINFGCKSDLCAIGCVNEAKASSP